MDAVELDLSVACIVGILDRERVDPQPLRVQLRMELDLERTGETGDLSASVDYGAVDAMVRFLAIEGQFRLIESLGVAILRLLLLPPGPAEARAPLARATVRVSKPHVMLASTPAVALARDAAWARGLPARTDQHRIEIISLSEVEVRRWALVAGDAPQGAPDLRAGALLGLAGMAGRLDMAALDAQFAAPCACTLLQVVRR